MIRTDKAALRVAAIAAEWGGRYALDHVQVESDGTCVATDGRRVVAVQGLPDARVEDASVLIQATHAAVVCGDAELGTPKYANIASDPSKTEVQYKSAPAVTATLKIPRVSGLIFPDWRSMLPEDEGELVGHFDVGYLAGVLETMASSLRALGHDRAYVAIRKHEKGVVSIAAEAGGRGLLGVIAPIKPAHYDGKREPSLDWVKK